MSVPTESPKDRAARLLRPDLHQPPKVSQPIKAGKSSLLSQFVNFLLLSVLAPCLLAAIVAVLATLLGLVASVLYLAYVRPSILMEVLAVYLVIDYVRRHKAAVKALLNRK